MWPSIPDGSVVEVRPERADAIRIGEVAAYERGGRITVHRLVSREARALVFQGDSLWRSDRPVDPRDVLGRATVVARGAIRWTPPRVVKLVGVVRAALAYLRVAAQHSRS